MTKTKRNQIFTTKKIESVLKKLDKLKKKEKSEFNLRETIFQFKDKLNNALKLGYSYEDLTNILSEMEVYISVNMLKQYLRDANSPSKSTEKKSDSVVSSGNLNDDDEETDLVNSSVDNSLKSSKNVASINSSERDKSSAKKAPQKDKHPKFQQQIEDSSPKKSPVLSGYAEDLSSDFNQY